MKLSTNWLCDYVDIKDEDLFTTLSLHTAEVEEVVGVGSIPNIVIGKITKLIAHPDADKLRVATVDTGVHGVRQIVCGAKNLEEGHTVPVALPGAMMPGGFEIKEAKLRGIESQGMICSEDELGLTAERQPGIMVLDNTLKAGEDFGSATGLADKVLEIENKSITNRPDLFGHYGIARECSVLFGKTLKPYLNNFEELPTGLPKLEVKIKENSACLRYCAIKIENVTPIASPQWLKRRLEAIGQKSINALVDVTNYVMQDLGQPMHAFDAEKLNGNNIEIGYGKDKEFLYTTLDGEERSISKNTLLITSDWEPVAVAGIIGGNNSCISEETSSIILESACFDADVIKKGQKALNLRTDASIRFEKALDPEQTIPAIHKAILLLKEIFPDMTIASELHDSYPTPKTSSSITTSLSFLNNRIGGNISKEKMIAILESLSISCDIQEDTVVATIPSWRNTGDLSIPEDLVEEIVRIYGYNNIPGSLPPMPMESSKNHSSYEDIRSLRNTLAKECHLAEVFNYSFYSRALHQGFLLKEEPITVLNPLSEEQEVMRTSLIPQLARHVAKVNIHEIPFGIFEIERVHHKKNLAENKHIGMVLAGPSPKNEQEITQWNQHPFFHLKKQVELLCSSFTKKAIHFETPGEEHLASSPYLHPGKSAIIRVNDTVIGVMGELHPLVLEYLDVKDRTIVCAEINMNALLGQKEQKTLKPISPFPNVTRDLTIIVSKDTPVGDILNHIATFSKEIISVELKDLFEGERLGHDKKSVSCSIMLNSMEDTLTDKQVAHITKGLFTSLIETFDGEIPGFG